MLYAEPVHQLRFAAVLHELLAGVAVVHSWMQRIVETEDFGRGMNMPLADQSRVIACGLELFADGRVGDVDAFADRPRRDDGPAPFVDLRDIPQLAHTGTSILPRNQRGTRRHTDRVGRYGVFKAHAAGRQSIDMGCAYHLVAIAANFKRPQLIADTKYYIWFFAHR